MSELPTPADFYSDTPPPRIIGTEMEYVAPILYEAIEAHDFIAVLDNLGIKTPKKLDQGFLSNGARLYQDLFSLEYATGEALGPREAAMYDHAGVKLIAMLDDYLTNKSRYSHRDLTSVPQRRSGTMGFESDVKDAPQKHPEYFSRGYHENYLCPRNLLGLSDEGIGQDIIEAHLFSRGIITGAGMVGARRALFSPVQKMPSIGASISNPMGIYGSSYHDVTSTYNKPLALVRDIHSDDNDWLRLEVRSGDPHMTPYMTTLALAMTSLVLRIIEHKNIFSREQLSSVQTVQNITANYARDFNPHAKHSLSWLANKNICMKEGEYISAFQLQQRLSALAVALTAYIDLPSDEVAAAYEWRSLADKLEAGSTSNDFSAVTQRVEWAAKLKYLQDAGYLTETGEGTGTYRHWEALAADYKWSMVSQGALWRKALKPTHNLILEPNEREIASSVTRTPKGTRAELRGKIIGAMANHDATYDWSSILDITNDRFYILDPYQTDLGEPISTKYDHDL